MKRFNNDRIRKTKNVLLVEGSSPARERHTKTLEKNGYQVISADDIESARALYEPRKFTLVVVSLNGFGNDAANFCNEIKDTDDRQVVALIFNPDQELPATDCPTMIFTTEPDEYFLARVETLTAEYAA
jgi:response regulator RpfG family c-di-GMP phosphodiesterase